MGRTTFAIASTGVAACLLAASASDPGGRKAEGTAAAREAERLQGDWTMVALEVDGKTADATQTRAWLLVVEGDQYNPGSGEVSIQYTFRLDPTRLPKAIDLVPADGTYRGRVFRGVYALEGDLLTVCRPIDPTDDRPAGLAFRRGPGFTRVVWKRRKA